jgi:hypothetical protein
VLSVTTHHQQRMGSQESPFSLSDEAMKNFRKYAGIASEK